MNDYKRLICIGDVHGCLDELKQLLHEVNYDREAGDRLIFVGDLVDRGPYSVEVVRFVKEHNLECVLGNHDEKICRFYKHEVKRLESISNEDRKLYKNPMKLSFEREKTYSMLHPDELEWMANLPRVIHIPELNLAVVHGGVRPSSDPLNQHPNVYIYCRFIHNDTKELARLDATLKQPPNTSQWSELYDGTMNIVYGHHVESMEEPVVRTNAKGAKTFGIDNGCCFGGRMTALVINNSGLNKKNRNVEEFDYLQVYAKQQYKSY